MGELEHVSKSDLLNFMKHRINTSLKQIGLQDIFDINESQLRP